MATDPGTRGPSLLERLLPLLLATTSLAAATPADLRSALDKAANALSQAEKGVVRGHDPGRVSLLLQRIDELLVSFQEESGLPALETALEEGRRAAHGSDLVAAAAAVRGAGDLMPAVTDYVVLREAAETSRAALRAAEVNDGPAFMSALDRFDASILAPVLLARVREARAAIARARQAMVMNNMQDGRARIAEVRRALGGLAYAGALSRASFSLAIASELLESKSVIAARDQLNKAMRDLKVAAASGPAEESPRLQELREETVGIWKRSGRAAPGDPARLKDLALAVGEIRTKQPR